MGAPSLASKRPAATSLPNFSLPPPDIPSTRYPNHPSAAMAIGSSDRSFGPLKASPLTSAAPQAASVASSNSFPPLSSTNVDVIPSIPHSTNPPSTSVLTPAGAVPDGLTSSGSHSNSSQSSPPGGPALFYSNHMTGSWPTPGGSTLSGYTYTASNPVTASTGPLAPPTYTRAPPSYGSATSPSLQHFPGRSASSSATNGENLPTSQSYQDQQPFPNSVAAGGGGGGGALGSPLTSQAPGSHQQSGLGQPILGGPASSAMRPITTGPGTQGVLGTSQEGGSYRQPPTPTSIYPPTSTAQQSSFPPFPSPVTQPSPVTSPATSSGPIPRVLGSIGAMSPPLQFPGGRGHPMPPIGTYASYGPMPGPVLSNMHHPGSPLAMVGGMPGLGGYGHHSGLSPHHPHSLYAHHGNAPTQHADRDRPFKCNECAHAFNRNHDLKRHKRIHLAVKPFPCVDCDKRFSRKDALKRHRLVKGCGGRSNTEGTGNTAGDNERSPSDRGDSAIDKREGSPFMTKKE